MRNLVSCVVLCLALFSVAETSSKGDLRLIALNETSQAWMTPAQVMELALAKITFIDITDFRHPRIHRNRPSLVIPGDPSFPNVVNPLLGELDQDTLMNYVRELSQNFATRYYTSEDGERAAIYLADQYFQASNGRSDVTIERFKHSWRQDSVIARIQGEGPNADELVIVGGHIDSTASPNSAAPGADDDASGSCTVLEIFRALAGSGFRPKRTVEFHGYSAEEIGLRGSQDIVNDYVNKGIDVFGMMQLDMTGYVRPGTVQTIGIVTDFVDPQLSAFVRKLVDSYTDLSWSDTRCGYGCSDHASWNRAGYPSSFPFEGLFGNSNPYIHSRNDLISHLNPQHMLEIAKLGLSFVVEMSLAP